MHKILITALALAFSAGVAQAKPNAREVERKVGVLSKMAFGYEKHKVRGDDAADMIIRLAVKQKQETREYIEENFTRNLPAKDIAFGDMGGWGTMKLPAAIALYESDDSDEDDKRPSKKVGVQLLRELAKMEGVSFGYTDGSSGYCGILFMGLLIVDELNDTIYEVSLTPSGGC